MMLLTKNQNYKTAEDNHLEYVIVISQVRPDSNL